MAGRKEERFDTTREVKLEQGRGIARNVSATGIYFVTDVAVETGARLIFTLVFDDYPSGPLQVNCEARVVRVEQRERMNGVAADISRFEFHRLAPKAHERS